MLSSHTKSFVMGCNFVRVVASLSWIDFGVFVSLLCGTDIAKRAFAQFKGRFSELSIHGHVISHFN